ncbi:MAG: hypothetical protein MPL62_10930 [Alphaproteobacteria bacterium]|nr:hypothetical protein [Alphaproteobacteria bacterium]
MTVAVPCPPPTLTAARLRLSLTSDRRRPSSAAGTDYRRVFVLVLDFALDLGFAFALDLGFAFAFALDFVLVLTLEAAFFALTRVFGRRPDSAAIEFAIRTRFFRSTGLPMA